MLVKHIFIGHKNEIEIEMKCPLKYFLDHFFYDDFRQIK